MTPSAKAYGLKFLIAASIFHAVMAGKAFSAGISVPQNESTWLAQTPISIDEKGVSLEIDKRGKLMLAMPNVATASFDYETDGNFLAASAAIPAKGGEIDYQFIERKKIWSGKGRVTFDFRRADGWSPGCRPLLILEGTGKFRIENLMITTPENLNDYGREKASAFFWKPITIWHTTINYLTPAYWDAGSNIAFSELLGAIYLALTALAVLAGIISKKAQAERWVARLSITAAFIFALHFAVRMAPSANYNVFDSGEEKIKLNYYYPEFGLLTSKALDMFMAGDTVAVMHENGDWFSPEALCFNLAPLPCVFYEPDKETLYGNPWPGLPTYVKAESREVNAIASYNSEHPLPGGFKKVYELNKNVFIARKE